MVPPNVAQLCVTVQKNGKVKVKSGQWIIKPYTLRTLINKQVLIYLDWNSIFWSKIRKSHRFLSMDINNQTNNQTKKAVKQAHWMQTAIRAAVGLMNEANPLGWMTGLQQSWGGNPAIHPPKAPSINEWIDLSSTNNPSTVGWDHERAELVTSKVHLVRLSNRINPAPAVG